MMDLDYGNELQVGWQEVVVGDRSVRKHDFQVDWRRDCGWANNAGIVFFLLY